MAVVESGVRASDVIDDCIGRKGKAIVESGVRASVVIDDLLHNTTEVGGLRKKTVKKKKHCE